MQRAGTAPRIAGAVAAPVVDLILGPLRPARVFAAHSAAAIVICDVDDDARIVSVLTAEASGVPNGVRTALHAADRPFAHLSPGDAAFVGAGGVRLPGLDVHAVRTVRTAIPLIHPAPAAVRYLADTAHAAPRGVADAPVHALGAAIAAGTPAAVRAAVTALVGLGVGSTPGGDDVLAGTLAGLHATGRAGLAHQVAVAALHEVAARTPLISADLLRLAARGHACAEAAAAIRACDRRHVTSPAPAVARLLRVGHTSGADLATGLALGLAAPARPAATRPRLRAPSPART